jgi:hypothetical protein
MIWRKTGETSTGPNRQQMRARSLAPLEKTRGLRDDAASLAAMELGFYALM